MTPISKENIIKYLKPKGWHKYMDDILEKLKEAEIYWFECYASKDNRFVLQTTQDSNLPTNSDGSGWNLHIDNSDMSTIANCSVEFIEQVETLMEIYKDY